MLLLIFNAFVCFRCAWIASARTSVFLACTSAQPSAVVEGWVPVLTFLYKPYVYMHKVCLTRFQGRSFASLIWISHTLACTLWLRCDEGRSVVCGVLAEASLWWGDPNCSSTSHRQILYTTDVFVAIATVVSSGLWWLQNSYGKRYDICDTPEIKASMLCRGEASWTLQSNILCRILTVLEPL